ncbi:MAG: C1 family peptidase [Labilithrix sp.]|nr:C1 family peptidase [Labilithrix sp.]
MTEGGINFAKVQEIAKRNPKGCGYVEVSEKNWIHIDCARYTPSAKAVPRLSPRKAKVVKSRQYLFTPLRTQLRNSALKGGGGLSLNGGGGGTAIAAGGAPGAGGPIQIGENFPDTVDHRTTNLEGPIKNQGGVGSCTGHSLSSALDNAAIRAGNLKPNDLDRMTSPMHVWSRYGLPNMGAAADGNIAQPVGVYTTWKQNDREACMLFQGKGSYATECAEAYGVKANGWREDKNLMAKYDKSQAEGIYKISSIEKLQVEPPDMDELLGILAGGADIWAAFLIDGRSWMGSAMKNAVMPDWTSPSSGHAVVISGYRNTPTGRQFLIHNSWGTSWGEGGYAWMSEKMVTKFLYYAYKVKITNGVRKEDLTDDDCAPDELVDLTTGICAVMCSDDSRPNNGCKK